MNEKRRAALSDAGRTPMNTVGSKQSRSKHSLSLMALLMAFASALAKFARARISQGLVIAAIAALSGCASDGKLTPPVPLQSPWSTDQTWAVLPFTNESGVSVVDTMAIADHFVAEIDSVDGLSCVPLNRSLAAMRTAGIRAITSDADARAMLRLLNVDGVLVGTVTAYDPYRPFRFGVAVQIYTEKIGAPEGTSADAITLATSESHVAVEAKATQPSTQVSRVYDANNHDTLTRLAAYSAGRYAPKSGMRAEVYLASMDRYSRFVAYDVVQSLLNEEAARFAPRPEVAGASSK